MNDSGNLAWMITASALVLLMTPGLAFFYGGLVRAKNIVNTMMFSFISMGLATIVWVLWGYSLAFSGSGSFIGNLDMFGLNGLDVTDGDTIIFIAFQGMFAIITPALIAGAFAERFKFSTYMVFLVLWLTLVYAPICHWVWAPGGWLFERGALDFAGGTVVHINAGIAAVAAAWLLGPRRNISNGVEPHSVPFVLLGAGLLWFGWFGFNAGSELAADARAAMAFFVTNIAAGTALTAWVILQYVKTGRFSAVGAASGAVAGLVAITPASGFVGPMGALAIGAGAGALCYGAVLLRAKLSLDDALEVFPVHGIGGIWGALMTGVFAIEAIGGTKGLLEGNGSIMIEQIIAILATLIYGFIVSAIILKVLDLVMGLRVSENAEDIGTDITSHGERGYVADGADA
jgi:Amt family ammonium transporter